jgi:hypothetical protein
MRQQILLALGAFDPLDAFDPFFGDLEPLAAILPAGRERNARGDTTRTNGLCSTGRYNEREREYVLPGNDSPNRGLQRNLTRRLLRSLVRYISSLVLPIDTATSSWNSHILDFVAWAWHITTTNASKSLAHDPPHPPNIWSRPQFISDHNLLETRIASLDPAFGNNKYSTQDSDPPFRTDCHWCTHSLCH